MLTSAALDGACRLGYASSERVRRCHTQQSLSRRQCSHSCTRGDSYVTYAGQVGVEGFADRGRGPRRGPVGRDRRGGEAHAVVVGVPGQRRSDVAERPRRHRQRRRTEAHQHPARAAGSLGASPQTVTGAPSDGSPRAGPSRPGRGNAGCQGSSRSESSLSARSVANVYCARSFVPHRDEVDHPQQVGRAPQRRRRDLDHHPGRNDPRPRAPAPRTTPPSAVVATIGAMTRTARPSCRGRAAAIAVSWSTSSPGCRRATRSPPHTQRRVGLVTQPARTAPACPPRCRGCGP